MSRWLQKVKPKRFIKKMKGSRAMKTQHVSTLLLTFILCACSTINQASPSKQTSLPTIEPTSTELPITPTLVPADENLRLTISQRSYSLSDKIEVEITVIGENVYFVGPCNWWFEKKTNQGWEPAGECPDTNFVDEPFGQSRGNKLSFSLPTSDQDHPYTFNYVLSPGIYRYGIAYGTSSGSSTAYSPAFELNDD